MEMIKTNAFCELSNDEMQKVDGGIGLGAFLIMLGKGALATTGGWLVCKGLDHIYSAIGKKTGWWK